MTTLPTGTVTFLFTDIEGSTKLLNELGAAYRQVQDDHMRIMREAIAEGGGKELRTEGDAFFAVFPSATGAVGAATTAQRAFASHHWSHERPLRVRMGLHTGEGLLGGDDYLSIDVNRAARIAAAGHGGQVLLSEATRGLVHNALPDGVSIADLGEHRLKDFDQPQRLHQLAIEGLQAEFPPLKTLDVPINLPAHLTSFVGRERELRLVTEFVQQHRIVTLTGPGGSGKTRLAIEAASRLSETFPDGTYFVDLSPITDPTILAETIAEALRLRTESGLTALQVLIDQFRQRSSLILLDNFEQVLEGAGTVATILQAAPQVRTLITSRAPLALSGEREVPVPPLSLPETNGDLELLRRSEAVVLFAERAAAVNPGFSLTDDAVPIVANICARLDALPLAIELAASRSRVLPLERMFEQLDRRLPLLVGGPRDAPQRQRTLRGAIGWSYDLLDDRTQPLFRRLSVFSGGWTLDGAGSVALNDDDLSDVIELIEILVQHSLVQRDLDDPEGRFRMLETIREFGLERLNESGEADDVRHRHLQRFLEIAEEAEPHLTGPDQRRWMDLLTREHDNLRAALGWAIESDRGEAAMRLAGSVWRFWYARSHLEEARRWLEAAVSLSSSSDRNTTRARCLTALGGIAYWQNDLERSDECYEEAYDIYRALNDRNSLVEARFNLAMTKGVRGEPETAVNLLEESLKEARELGDRRGEAWALWGLSAARMFGGDLEGAQGPADESGRIFEEIRTDTWGLGNSLAGQAGLAAGRGDAEEARERVLRALDAWEDQGNALVIAAQLRFLGIAAIEAARPERAVRLAGVASAIREKIGGQVPDAFFPFRDPKESAAEVLDKETVERLWNEGRQMALEEALAYAREDW